MSATALPPVPSAPVVVAPAEALPDEAPAVLPMTDGIGVNRYVGVVEPFEGHEDVETWLEHFNWIATSNRWSDGHQCVMFHSFMTGIAKTWYKGLAVEDRRDLTKLKAAFRSAFTSANYMEEALRRLAQNKRTQGQTLIEYQFVTLTMCQKANPRMTDLEKMLHFSRGLDEELQKDITMAGCTTMEDAMNVARRKEGIRKAFSESCLMGVNPWMMPQHLPTSNNKVESEKLRLIEESIKRIEQSQEKLVAENKELEKCRLIEESQQKEINRRDFRPAPRMERRPIREDGRRPTCFNCHKIGHIAAKCWNRDINGKNAVREPRREFDRRGEFDRKRKEQNFRNEPVKIRRMEVVDEESKA
ncbi:MAG: hypothetical protein ACYCUI_15345 [Vulcanimicrobiaceae bacterium]